ncbi:MAG: HAD family hydrolase [Muribaculaceae bacterium]|nr:HAD family hydrolase [Muribaculaceae bacterium]
MSTQFIPKGILFDLDGVLLDTETIYTRIWNDIDRIYPTGVDNFAHAIKGNTLPRILSTYFPDPEVQPKVVELLRESEESMDYPVFEGVMDFLDSLAAANVPAAIVTSSGDDKMERIGRSNSDFMSRFAALITDSCVTHSKPHPEPYLKGAEAIGVAPEDCIVFEDSFAGIEAGKAAGARVVALATTNSRESLEGRADALIDNFVGLSLSDILQML